MSKFTLKDAGTYDADIASYPFITSFDNIIRLLKKYLAKTDATAQKILTDAEIYLTPLYHTETDPPQPYVQIDFYIDDDHYIDIYENKEYYQELIKNNIKKLTPVKHLNDIEVDIVSYAFWSPVGGEPWRMNPQYQFRDGIEAVTQDVVEKLWGSASSLHVFISHRSDRSHRAHILKQQLSDYGISSFVAHNDIEPTEEWQIYIEKALYSSDALVALVCDDFSPNAWTDQEIGIALGRQIPVCPITLTRTAKPSGFLQKIQAFRAEGDIMKRLLPRFIADTRTAPATIASLLHVLPEKRDIDVDDVLSILMRAPATAWKTAQKERFSNLYHRRPVLRKSPLAQQLFDDLDIQSAKVSRHGQIGNTVPF